MEKLSTGVFAFYAKWKDEDDHLETIELYDPSDHKTHARQIFKNLIDQKWNERYPE